MKQSLKNAIALFTLNDRLKLYVALAALKLKISLPGKLSFLFQKCMDYVRVFESGVFLEKAEGVFIKATLTINSRTVSVFLRSNSSDLQVLESVFLHHEYKPAVQHLLETKNQPVKQIVDAGGNIGLTSIYFLCFFSDARFTIIEPDERNFSLLKKNIEANGLRNALLLKNALWISNEPLVIDDSFRDGKEWSLTVGSKALNNQPETRAELTGITLQDICLQNGNDSIDLFKIDIEGAERFLFTNTEFLKAIDTYVKGLVIEIHDEYQIRATINGEMHRMLFTKDDYGDITLYTRQFKQA